METIPAAPVRTVTSVEEAVVKVVVGVVPDLGIEDVEGPILAVVLQDPAEGGLLGTETRTRNEKRRGNMKGNGVERVYQKSRKNI